MPWKALKTIGSYIGLLVVAVLLIQTMTTTYQLGKIDSGLKTSLDSTNQLIQIQTAIIQKNKSLKDVVATTKQMDTELNTTLKTTQSIQAHIHSINDLNTATLQLNQQMGTLGAQSGQTLGSIATGMGDLEQSTNSLYSALNQLHSSTSQDRSNLDRMKTDTDQMNQKLPGVLK